MTPEQKSGLARLMLRWPDRRNQLMRAMQSPVADLYASYQQASVAFIHWSHQNKPGAIAIADDYRRILNELEQEIANALAQHPPD